MNRFLLSEGKKAYRGAPPCRSTLFERDLLPEGPRPYMAEICAIIANTDCVVLSSRCVPEGVCV